MRWHHRTRAATTVFEDPGNEVAFRSETSERVVAGECGILVSLQAQIANSEKPTKLPDERAESLQQPLFGERPL